MDEWGNWEMSAKNRESMDKLLRNIKSQNESNVSKAWKKIFNTNHEDSEMDVDSVYVYEKQNKVLIDLINESLETGSNLPERAFNGISIQSFYQIFFEVKKKLSDHKFFTFCEYVITWNNDLLIEQALKAVVLQTLRDCEISTYITFSLKELAKKKPDQLCHHVFIPLLTNENCAFSEIEVLDEVFQILENSQKNLLIMNFIEKEKVTERDWMFINLLIHSLSPEREENFVKFLLKWSTEYSLSINFGRVLSQFCKCFSLVEHKETIREVIQKHNTLFKNGALKNFEKQIENLKTFEELR